MVFLGEILAGVKVKVSQEWIVDCGGGDLYEGGGGGGGGGVVLVPWLEGYNSAGLVSLNGGGAEAEGV